MKAIRKLQKYHKTVKICSFYLYHRGVLVLAPSGVATEQAQLQHCHRETHHVRYPHKGVVDDVSIEAPDTGHDDAAEDESEG